MIPKAVAALGILVLVASIPTSAQARHHTGIHKARVHGHHAARRHHVGRTATRHHRAHRRGVTHASAPALACPAWDVDRLPSCNEPLANLHPSDIRIRSSRPAAWQWVGGRGDLVAEARRHLGETAGQLGLPRRDWCSDFMNYVARRVGLQGSGSRLARSWAHAGRRLPGPEIGAVAVLSRGRRGGHVGVVSGIDPAGNPIIISGNHGHRVGEGVYPLRRVIVFVAPS